MFAGKTNGPIWLAICAALFLRALVPAGWMIDVDPGDGAIMLRICEAQTPGFVDEVQAPAHAPVDHAAMGHSAMVGEHERVAQTDHESLTGRLGYEHEGAIEGHYNGPHNHATPADRQQNYGGDTVLAAFGANIALPFGGAIPVQLGLEGGVPIYQNLNGIQLPEKWRFSAALTTTL